MQFVQTVITDELARLAAMAAERAVETLPDEEISEAERNDLRRLAVFFSEVYTHPTRFAPSGTNQEMVKRIIRKAKGPAQPLSRKNKRKARQEKRIGYHKRRRKERRELAEAWNEAQQRIEAEQAEAEKYAAELAEKIKGERKFDVLSGNGDLILAGVPESFIRPAEGEEGNVEPSTGLAPKSQIILPAGIDSSELDELRAS